MERRWSSGCTLKMWVFVKILKIFLGPHLSSSSPLAGEQWVIVSGLRTERKSEEQELEIRSLDVRSHQPDACVDVKTKEGQLLPLNVTKMVCWTHVTSNITTCYNWNLMERGNSVADNGQVSGQQFWWAAAQTFNINIICCSWHHLSVLYCSLPSPPPLSLSLTLVRSTTSTTT